MADDNWFHVIMGKALVDPDFRANITDPAKQLETLQSIGLDPTAEQLDALNGAIEAVNEMGNKFGPPVQAA